MGVLRSSGKRSLSKPEDIDAYCACDRSHSATYILLIQEWKSNVSVQAHSNRIHLYKQLY